MLYLNNAGTTWPKPASVHKAVQEFQALEPTLWGAFFTRAHLDVAAFFNIKEPSRFLFTPGCTSALALAIMDLPWEPGDALLTSAHEHHAVGRWAQHLSQTRGVEHRVVPMTDAGLFDLSYAEDQLRDGSVRLVACTMASNVTGALLPAQDLVVLAHRYGALCLLDGAQTAGVLPIDIEAIGADMFAFAGHKGPLGPQGIGGLYIAPTVSMASPSAVCGLPTPGQSPPACLGMVSYCDLGSVNMAALSGLRAGLAWLEEEGVNHLREKALKQSALLYNGLQGLSRVSCFGPTNATERSAVISLQMEGIGAGELGQRLQEEFSVVGSAGFHCAPMAHEALGTHLSGTLRLSTGPFTSDADIHVVLDAITQIEGSL